MRDLGLVGRREGIQVNTRAKNAHCDRENIELQRVRTFHYDIRYLQLLSKSKHIHNNSAYLEHRTAGH